MDEPINQYMVINTHKELYCRRCGIYDCQLHGILSYSTFANPNHPAPEEMLQSYLIMLKNHMLTMNKRLDEGLRPCKSVCYLSKIETPTQITLTEFQISKIELALNVFQFNPCHIRYFFDLEEVTCLQIFLYLRGAYKDKFYDTKLYAKPASVVQNSRPKNRKQNKNFFANYKTLKEVTSMPYALECKPCHHHFYDKHTSLEEQQCFTDDCPCYSRGYCDKYCGCRDDLCKIKRKGCDCGSDCLGQKCLCYSLNAECDPDLCKCCFNVKKKDGTIQNKKNKCKNQMIHFKKNKLCKVGPSEVCTGLGLFNIEPIRRGEFVSVYLGEVISWQEAEVREKLNKYDHETYLSTLSDEFVIDAKFRGNKARFINHGKEGANLIARHMFSGGLNYFAFYAKDDIAPGSELFFDYEGDGSALRKQFSWIKDPVMPKRVEWPKKPPKSKGKVEFVSAIQIIKGPKLSFFCPVETTRKLRKIQQDFFPEIREIAYYAHEVDNEESENKNAKRSSTGTPDTKSVSISDLKKGQNLHANSKICYMDDILADLERKLS